MRVIILTEGSNEKGFGHIARCSSIYQAFKDKNISAKFIIDGDSSAESILQNMDYSFFNWLENKEDLFLKLRSSDIVILDSYYADDDFCKQLSGKVSLAVYIDDNNRIDYAEGIVVNGTVLAGKFNYPSHSDITYLLGSEYVPLRKEFWDSSLIEIKDEIKSVLITMGGNDLRNLTPSLLSKLNKEFPNLKKKVIIGDSFDNSYSIEQFSDENTELIYSPDAQGMKDAMLGSDIAISSGGQTLYELACLGIPTIAVCVAENQLNNIRNWQKLDFIEFAGNYMDKDLIDNVSDKIGLLNDFKLRESKQLNGSMAVDGKGALRIVKKIIYAFYEKNSILRAVKSDDCFDIFEIANDDEVRKSSFNSDKIRLEDHKVWFSNMLKDDSVKFLVLEYAGDIIGQLRFDLDDEFPVVSISLDKEYRGFGLSKLLLSKALSYLNRNYNFKKVIAYIKRDNVKSISFFESMGFNLVKSINIKGNNALMYTYDF